MKKRLITSIILILSLLLLSILFISFVSAYTFNDVLSGKVSFSNYIKEKITGKAISGSCTDSDDGKDYYVKGEINTPYDSNSDGYIIEGKGHAVDRCTSGTQLNEYYCENNYGKSVGVACSLGCENGACISTTQQQTPQLCTDTDNGLNSSLKGTCHSQLSNKSLEDGCIDESSLNEYYCRGDGYCDNNVIECNYGCSDGVCLPRSITIPNTCSLLNMTFYNSWHATCSSSKYNLTVDFNNDKTIDFYDLILLADNIYNEQWCINQLNKTTDPCITQTIPLSCQELNITLTSAWHKSCGNSNYNKSVDINNDKTIDIYDLILFGDNAYNESWCLEQITKQISTCEERNITTNQTTNITQYQCSGFVQNSLCYIAEGSKPIINIKDAFSGEVMNSTFSIQGLRFSFTFPSEVRIGEIFNFSINIQNAGNEQKTLTYILFANELNESESNIIERYELISFDNFENATPNSDFKGSYDVSILPLQTISASFKIKAMFPNILFDKSARSFASFNIYKIGNNLSSKEFRFKNRILYEEGSLCGNYVFPESFTNCGYLTCRDYYWNSKCCNNVFYPDLYCCSDSDCVTEKKCIDGKCLSHTKSFESYHVAPIGTKRLLIFSLANITSEDECTPPKPPTGLSESIDNIEIFYDNKARELLNKSNDFLNFNWTYYGSFNINNLNLTPGYREYEEIVNQVIEKCNLDKSQYDIFVIEDLIGRYGARTHDKNTITMPQGFKQPDASSFAHEISHTFGCTDLQYSAGGYLQWFGNLMGKRNVNESIAEFGKLDVCRGEMGWYDFDKDSLIDVEDPCPQNPDLNCIEEALELNRWQRFLSWFKELFA